MSTELFASKISRRAHNAPRYRLHADVHALRRQPEVKAAQAAVVGKHGSRRGMPGGGRNAQGEERPAPRPAPRGRHSAAPGQLSLDF